MFIWWLLGSIGCLCVSIIYCQDNAPQLADIEPPVEKEVKVEMSVADAPPQQITNDTNNLPAAEGIVTETTSTTTQTPEPFSCHECLNCTSKSNFIHRVCDPGIMMCYEMHKRIDNTSRIIRRGCSTTKNQCTVPEDGQSRSFDSITCCTSHKCNQATQFKPFFFLSILSLFYTLVIIINT